MNYFLCILLFFILAPSTPTFSMEPVHITFGELKSCVSKRWMRKGSSAGYTWLAIPHSFTFTPETPDERAAWIFKKDRTNLSKITFREACYFINLFGKPDNVTFATVDDINRDHSSLVPVIQEVAKADQRLVEVTKFPRLHSTRKRYTNS